MHAAGRDRRPLKIDFVLPDAQKSGTIEEIMSIRPINRLTPLRRLLKLLHPEGIPWPGSVVYDRISATGLFQEHYDRVAQHVLGYCSSGHLLDVGTGRGRLLITLHGASPCMHLAGIDVSPAMVARARKNMELSGFQRFIEIKEGAASLIPFPDDTFDIVVSTAAVHHWKDPIRGLNEIHRVLKGGRHALIYDVVSDTPSHVVEQMQLQFGRLRTAFFWIHALEEPFYSLANFTGLAGGTLFDEGEVRFVGILCCLILKKEIHDIVA